MPPGTLKRTLPGRLENQKSHPCGTPCKRSSARTLSGTRILGSQIRGLWDPHLAQWTQMSPPTLPGRLRDPSGTLTKFRFGKAIRDASLTLIRRRTNDHYRTLQNDHYRTLPGRFQVHGKITSEKTIKNLATLAGRLQTLPGRVWTGGDANPSGGGTKFVHATKRGPPPRSR